MLRQVFAATAAVAVLAGCSGGDDEPAADQSQGGGQTSSTPTTPAPTPYDPPKAFEVGAATALSREKSQSSFKPLVGMAGTTAVVNSLSAAEGHDVTGTAKPWRTVSADPAAGTTQTHDATAPLTVQVDGRPAIAVAYYQRVKGGGTKKPFVQVLFRWLDPADGKPVSEATIDVTPVIGEDEVNSGLPGGFTTQSADPATGQLVVGLAPTSLIAAKSGIFTVYADPTTKKTSTVPFLEPAGVVDGVVAGALGKDPTDRTLALADGATGKVTKSGLLPGLEGLGPAGSGVEHAYLYGQKYTKAEGRLTGEYVGSIYAVDPATGAVVPTKSAVSRTQYLVDYSCLGDGRRSVVCTAGEGADEAEIIGFDDTTGKKAWGYAEGSGARTVPVVTTAYHGLVYGSVGEQPVLLDALTGKDIAAPAPSAAPTGTASPTDTASPGDGQTPGDSVSPTDDLTPTDGVTPVQPDLKPAAPAAVSEFGGAYVRAPESFGSDSAGALQLLRAIG